MDSARVSKSAKNLRIVIGSYNVCKGTNIFSKAKEYKDLPLSAWILSDSGCHDEKPVDFYVLGFQEMADGDMEKTLRIKEAWIDELSKVFSDEIKNKNGAVPGYSLLKFVHLFGVFLIIYARNELLPEIRDVATDSVETRLPGGTGNKGGVAIRFDLWETSFCFVNSHLQPGQTEIKERCVDFANIRDNIKFPGDKNVESHDFIFWLGDLNFRIDMNRQSVKDLVSRQQWSNLLQEDQLRKNILSGNVFQDYKEGAISFAPTYKYDMFSDEYDTSEKQRIPAWTDRVLWKINQKSINWNTVKCLHYSRCELKQSDHRPIVAVLTLLKNIKSN